MAVYVDDMRREASIAGSRRARWSHLMADTTTELEAFARHLGLRPEWLQHAGTHREHYDITEYVRRKCVVNGAVEISYPRGTAELLARKRPVEDARRAWEALAERSTA